MNIRALSCNIVNTNDYFSKLRIQSDIESSCPTGGLMNIHIYIYIYIIYYILYTVFMCVNMWICMGVMWVCAGVSCLSNISQFMSMSVHGVCVCVCMCAHVCVCVCVEQNLKE